MVIGRKNKTIVITYTKKTKLIQNVVKYEGIRADHLLRINQSPYNAV